VPGRGNARSHVPETAVRRRRPWAISIVAMTDPLRVLVAGGGVAGLETLLALRDLAGDRVRCVLLTPEAEFVYRPMAVAEPFARGLAARHRLDEISRDVDAELVRGRLLEVDVDARQAVTDGRRLDYDALLIGVGAGSEPALPHALTWTPENDAEVYGGLLRDLDEGYTKRIAFVVPLGVAWPLPAYELALMTTWQARSMGHDDVHVTVYTPEEAPLVIFGAPASAAERDDLDEAGVDVLTRAVVTAADGPLRIEPGGRPLDAQRIVALPRAVGRAPAGIATDERGFVVCDPHGQVAGTDMVWAAGDATAFPIKQGGLAAQQADAAAEAIASRVGADVEPQPFHPVLRGVLLIGRGQRWMRGPDDADEGAAARHALFWPPTKIAGRYLAPYLAARDEAEALGRTPEPPGHAVQLDLEHDVPAAADALRAARRRGPRV
jgi:sulfide:quinone oxidoreductase